MFNKFSLLALCVILVSIIGLSSCEEEPQITQEKIFGTITIENTDVWQTWQDSGEVQITLFPEFSLDPLAGWGIIPDGTFGPGIPGGTYAVGAPYNSQNPIILEFENGEAEFSYEIEVEPGTYSALAMGFRHDYITDPSLKSAVLGVNFNNPEEVSHGINIKIDVGGGNIVEIFDFPAPTDIIVGEGEQIEVNFKADFAFVNDWF